MPFFSVFGKRKGVQSVISHDITNSLQCGDSGPTGQPSWLTALLLCGCSRISCLGAVVWKHRQSVALTHLLKARQAVWCFRGLSNVTRPWRQALELDFNHLESPPFWPCYILTERQRPLEFWRPNFFIFSEKKSISQAFSIDSNSERVYQRAFWIVIHFEAGRMITTRKGDQAEGHTFIVYGFLEALGPILRDER